MEEIKYLLFLFLLSGIFLGNSVKAEFLSWEIVMNNGFGEGNENRTITSLVVFKDYLYASVYNPTDGVKIFRSFDGKDWSQVNENGFGNSSHTSAVLFTDNNYLYAGTTGDGGISGFKLLKTSNGTDWVQIGEDGFGDVNNYAIQAITSFQGKIYISVFYIDFDTFDMGVRIYRIDSDSSWTKVNEEGFGDSNNAMCYTMNVFNDQLYVGTFHAIQGPEIWRSQNGANWSRVIYNGFGEINGHFFSSIFSFHQQIYASMMSETGFELWRSNSGDEGSWDQVGEDGFGDINNIATSFSPVIVNDRIYFGTGNESLDLAKIYTSQDGENWAEEDNSSFVDAGDEGIWTGTFFKNRIYFAISNEDIGARIIRSQELPVLSIKDINSLPEAKIGQPYSYQLKILNGTPPYICTWSGDLPEGMTVTPDCKIQGTPKHASNHIFTVYLVDSGMPAQNYFRQFILKVNEEYVKELPEKHEGAMTELPETGDIIGKKFLFINIFLWISMIAIIKFIFSKLSRRID